MASSDDTALPSRPPWGEETGVWATYDMHCHCGAIRWTMKISPPLLEREAQGKEHYTATECLCSHCARNGAVSAHPRQENVKFTRGREDLKEYYSGKKISPHLFCPVCASNIAIDLQAISDMTGGPRYAMNLRMLKDISIEELTIQKSTAARDWPPKYEIK